MKTINIKNCISSCLDADFKSIISLQIEEKPFAEGGFGKVFHCKKINNKKYSNPQVIKIFKDNGQGSAEHSFNTILGLQSKILEKKKELEALKVDFLEYYPAFLGAPQFVFEGELEGEIVQGYSANNLTHLGYVCFSDILNDPDIRDKYFELPLELTYSKAYHLSRAFDLLKEFNYIHADFKTDNFFVSLNDGLCALIDFDSGAIIKSVDDDTYTWGTPQDMLAPEIFQQIKNDSFVKVNLFSDMWSVAIANHYLIFSMNPMFFLHEITPDSIAAYRKDYEWPHIDTNSPLFAQDALELYEWYLDSIKDLPLDIFNCFKYTVTHGYSDCELRTSYSQWAMKFEAIIPEEEKRLKLSRIKRRLDRENNPPPKKTVEEKDFPGFIFQLIKDLIDKKTYLYEHKDKLTVISKELNKPDLYDMLDKFLLTYYEAWSDNILTNVEKNKLKFLLKRLGVLENDIKGLFK